jgi:hypothetical protein
MKNSEITIKIYDPKSPGFFKKVYLNEDYVVKLLGFDKKVLLESHDDMALYEQIYNEHILFEGFLDSVKTAWEKAKKTGGQAAKLFDALKNLFDDPSRLEVAKEQAMALATRAIKPVIAKNDVIPSVKKMLEEMEKAARAKGGWKGFVSTATLLLLSETIRDNVDAFTMEGMQQTFIKMLEDLHNDIMADSPFNTVISWISRLGKVLASSADVVNSLYRILLRVDAVTLGKGRVVDDMGGSAPVPV